MSEAVFRRCSVKRYSEKPCKIHRKTPEQVFSCEFGKNFMNTFFVEHLGTVSYEMYTLLVSLKSF